MSGVQGGGVSETRVSGISGVREEDEVRRLRNSGVWGIRVSTEWVCAARRWRRGGVAFPLSEEEN